MPKRTAPNKKTPEQLLKQADDLQAKSDRMAAEAMRAIAEQEALAADEAWRAHNARLEAERREFENEQARRYNEWALEEPGDLGTHEIAESEARDDTTHGREASEPGDDESVPPLHRQDVRAGKAKAQATVMGILSDEFQDGRMETTAAATQASRQCREGHVRAEAEIASISPPRKKAGSGMERKE
jgi:hypothetical protein